jgi:probable phosphoglycerate mutase
VNRLILIRHAQSEHHTLGLSGGWTDTPLTPFGHAQAELLAARCALMFADEPGLCLYSSDLQRAAQTAEHVARALGRTCVPEPGLREINNGAAAGLTWEEADRIQLPKTEPAIHWLPYPYAESWYMMGERVAGAMERISRACPSTTIVVTHGGSGKEVITWWLRLNDGCRERVSFELDPASISELAISPRNERTLVRLNDTGHLLNLRDPAGL